MEPPVSEPSPGRQQADLLVTGLDWLITVDQTRRVIRDAGVAIRDRRFAAVGKTAEVMRVWSAPEIIDGRGLVATPGFVDNHLHSSFHLSRGLADEVNAQEFLFKCMYPYEGKMTSEDVYASALLAAMELLRHGVTCFVDPGNYHPEDTVRACWDTGIRIVVARSTFDLTSSVLGLLPESMIDTTQSALEETERVLEQFQSKAAGTVRASASFRGLNNASDKLIEGLRELADRYDTFLQMHAAFSYSTHDASVAQHGVPEIIRLEKLGVLNEKTLIVHSGWLEPKEVEILVERKPTLVAAPSSSVHNGYGNLEVGLMPELLAFGVNVALGSDHASSGAVDMCREMYLATCGYKEARVNPRIMPPETGVEMATLNGAIGAGLGEELGSVEVGKQADLVMFDAEEPEWLPLYNPVSNLVYSATGSTVRHVLVGGEVRVRDGRLLSFNEDEVRALVHETSARIAGRLDT
jgi:5-methylthioadenosine/S-adenosylhomocysteine deaminase